MMINYGYSIRGKSHLLNGKKCQDAHAIVQLSNGWFAAAIADGVGSAKNADIGAVTAVDSVINFIQSSLPWDYTGGTIFSKGPVISMLRTSFYYAFNQIWAYSKLQGEPIESYDTTLTVAIYDGTRVIYAHSGDGGILVLTTFGSFAEVTKPKKGPDGISVQPLRFGNDCWEFGVYEEDIAGVLLVTDGMRGILCPYKDLQTLKDEIYIPLATYFCDPNGFTGENPEAEKNQIKDFICSENNYSDEFFYRRLNEIYKRHMDEETAGILVQNIYDNGMPGYLMRQVEDDKTLVALINPDMMLDNKPSRFFEDPDWNEMQEKRESLLYPELKKSNDFKVNTWKPKNQNENKEPTDSEDQKKDEQEEAEKLPEISGKQLLNENVDSEENIKHIEINKTSDAGNNVPDNTSLPKYFEAENNEKVFINTYSKGRKVHAAAGSGPDNQESSADEPGLSSGKGYYKMPQRKGFMGSLDNISEKVKKMLNDSDGS